ncbi:MAG TPA: cytochrome P450 [Myxococcaceae bacterium]|nr:cytochrome P450 [Myxococcaceae bacterium]
MTTTALPPGPKQPAMVQFAQWILRPFEFMEECQRRFGDTFTWRITGFGNLLLTSAPELIREIYAAPPETVYSGKANELLRPVLGNHSLILLDGQEHLRERRLLLPPFHGERMQAYTRVMRDATEDSMANWPKNQPFPLLPRTQAITLEVILRAVFGLEESGQVAELAKRIVKMLEFNNPALAYAPEFLRKDVPLSPMRRFYRLRRAVDELIYALIAERRSKSTEGRTDILSLLLSAKDEAGQPMTDEELRDELVTLLLAGHETTASALAWVVERLLTHPEALQKVRTELDAVLGGGRFEPSHLPKLEYLDAVIKETLRLRPVLPLTARIVVGDFSLGGRPIPKGTYLMSNIYLAHRRSQVYPEPEKFKPERFVGNRPDPYAWLPFGGGVRRCIGMAFAQTEMKVVLATMLSQVDLKLTHAEGERAVRRAVIFVPRKGTEVVITGPRERTAPLRAAG